MDRSRATGRLGRSRENRITYEVGAELRSHEIKTRAQYRSYVRALPCVLPATSGNQGSGFTAECPRRPGANRSHSPPRFAIDSPRVRHMSE
jgi:hypothetical protein